MVNKNKPKRLLASLKEKKRYLVFELITQNSMNFKQIKEAISDSVKELFGLEGLAKLGLVFVDFNDNKGIVKVNNKGLDMLRASFCLLRKINKHDVVVRSLGVSGMLKKARIKFISGGGF